MKSQILRNITALSFLLSAMLGCIIYQIKHRVLDLEKTMHQLNREIINTNEGLHILKAEWGYLNQPRRLQALNNKYLQLRAIGHTQVASYQTLPVLIASTRTPSTSDRVLVAAAPQKVMTT
jgi:hypothetical protein